MFTKFLICAGLALTMVSGAWATTYTVNSSVAGFVIFANDNGVQSTSSVNSIDATVGSAHTTFLSTNTNSLLDPTSTDISILTGFLHSTMDSMVKVTIGGGSYGKGENALTLTSSSEATNKIYLGLTLGSNTPNTGAGATVLWGTVTTGASNDGIEVTDTEAAMSTFDTDASTDTVILRLSDALNDADNAATAAITEGLQLRIGFNKASPTAPSADTPGWSHDSNPLHYMEGAYAGTFDVTISVE